MTFLGMAFDTIQALEYSENQAPPPIDFASDELDRESALYEEEDNQRSFFEENREESEEEYTRAIPGITVVYKTYKNDIDWLKYSLLTFDKFCTDNIHEIIIYYHDQCERKLFEMLSTIQLKNKYRTIPVVYDIHGYLKQMVVKCMCFKDVKTEYIAFIDSDIIFTYTFSCKTYCIGDDGKIIWLIQRKNDQNNKQPQWWVWQDAVIKMTQAPMNTYYMCNGFPFFLKRKTLKEAYHKFLEVHKVNYNEFCRDWLASYGIKITDPISGKNGKFLILASIFEEFEYFGWYASRYNTADYNFTEIRQRNCVTKQFWSHGGLTEAARAEIEQLLSSKN